MKEYRAIGLMSGTSLDGIDAALLRTDGESFVAQEGFVFIPYPPDLRERIRACFGKTAAESRDVEHALTVAHAEAVAALIKETNTPAQDVDVIGFHGQTISHAPEKGETCQLGDGKLLARLTGIKTVNDFRTADVCAGGQGAPLVPVYHQALAAGLKKPVVFLNIGGVANVTYVGVIPPLLLGEGVREARGEGASSQLASEGTLTPTLSQREREHTHLFACDCGPGNALIDDWMLAKIGSPQDKDGAAAHSGKINPDILQKLLAHPYFDVPPPKSLDRNAFSSDMCKDLTIEDGAATLAAFTVQAIARTARFFPEPPQRWIVCGGGRHNRFLMTALKDILKAPVDAIETLGLNGDATEAEAFAYLAVRSLRGMPLSFPSTTGVKRPMQGGVLHETVDDIAA